MTFALNPSSMSRRIAFLLIVLVVAGALAAVTFGATGASHHMLLSPRGCGAGGCSSQPGFWLGQATAA